MTDKQTQAKTLFSGVKFDVQRLEVTRSDGGTVQREVIVHPGAVAVLPVLEDGRIVMIRNHRHAVRRTLLEIPAGTLESGEDPADCAGRELLEETGYRARRIEPLREFFTTPGICTERMHAFAAYDLQHEAQALEPTEQIEVQPMSPGEVTRALASGEIEDAKTIATILYWMRFGNTDPGT
jgi:ADP-ribose pyrophosphatase